MKGDGKDKFYRNLNLSSNTMDWMRWLNNNMEKIKSGEIVNIPEKPPKRRRKND